MLNVWLSFRAVRKQYPIKTKVKIFWPNHVLNGAKGQIQGYSFYGKNKIYLLELEVAILTNLHGILVHNIPWNRLILE